MTPSAKRIIFFILCIALCHFGFAADIQRLSLRDSARKRSVPVKMFFPSDGKAACPVVLFSLGLGHSREDCDYLGHSWAKFGIASVFIEHPGSNAAIIQGEFRRVAKLRNAYQQNWSARARTQDIIFVLNYIHEKPNSRFDLNKIGVAGFDLGALSALLLAGQQPPDGGKSLADPRIKAIVVMSPPVQQKNGFAKIYGDISAPTLFITGTRDDGIIGSTKANERRIPFDNIHGTNKFLVTLTDADHFIYAGSPIHGQRDSDAVFHTAIARISSLFWIAYLNDDKIAQEQMQNRTAAASLQGLGRFENGIDRRSAGH